MTKPEKSEVVRFDPNARLTTRTRQLTNASVVDKLLALLGLASCAGCGRTGPTGLLCTDCLSGLHPVINGCSSCGDHPITDETCLLCIGRPPPWQSCTPAYSYTRMAQYWLHAAKFHEDLAALRLLTQLVASVSLPPFDIVVPVPMPAVRHRRRGIHLALELARAAAQEKGKLRMALSAEDGQLQRGATRRQRLRLSSSRFTCQKDVSGRTVLLVDDVMTTGATLNAATRSLLDAGALQVHVFALLRTPSDFMGTTDVDRDQGIHRGNA